MRLLAYKIGWITLVLLVLFLAGCLGTLGQRQTRYTSSVVDYLYPKKEVVVEPSVPYLNLPLRVGVAFVPSTSRGSRAADLSETDKMALMERIAAEFRALSFVKEIELIPSAYLVREGSFTNLDQIRTMYGVDVIALLSFDQVQHTDEGLLSLSYWTIVGAYLVKGEKNDTSTMMDAAVYDIASRKMLFRAPGTSHVKGSATPVNLSEQLRIDSAEGFSLAADQLVVNLKDQLERFKEKVKQRPEEYVVKHRAGYTGGGSLGAGYALLVLGLGGWALRRGCKD
ncbi:rhombotarget lipoprotein [Syntrophotalea acetylenivorans]|uniref:Rhombotarget lipoprotein n=1 Tax=Syntrophotalea acetylenivorans TaxID=1842532 RepID=A0A1L3GQA4_9BACT|nr:rhombotarget lipoprotein [Syntrophotalea acetylenivorans]APG28107.1 rhombotarget lipoprotein [Syntrophotalea acetylenivorans]